MIAGRRRTPRGHARSGGRGGFTIFELLLAMTIIGVILAAGAISLRGAIPKYRLRTGGRALGTAIEHTRLTAVTRGAWLGIRYVITPGSREDADRPYFQVIPPAPEDDPYQDVEDRQFLSKQYFPVGVRIQKIILGGNQVVDRGAVNVLFSPMGNAGSHIAVLEGDAGRMLSVKLNSITGVIDFVEGPPVGFQHFQE